MADASDQTIKQMLAGFSAMQYNLGLLPMQTTQSMAGAPMQMPPPPPPVMHPAQAAANALAMQQQQIAATLQAAQMTRYQAPPSAPMPSIGAMGGFAAMGNPFAATGGGAMSGGHGGFVPQHMGVQMPSIFNPFAPSLPPAHFSMPAQRNLQMLRSAHSQITSTVAGIGEGAMGIGGSVLGGALGSVFGPLGSIAGSWLGGKIGGGIANMMFNPAVQDMARGRQIQAMTAPSMVSGAFLNSATGQGMNAFAARQVATGIRGLQNDADFERTGFNTQDSLRIMQMGADQGLIKGAMSPDAMVAKVKDLARTVKTLMRITGDPDVRSAMQSLGEMRELGFNGLGAQAGAVANRAMFARMAGVSQAQAGAYGMMGAGVAGQFGLGGSTGYMAGMSGAALANMAQSSGALNDLQMARAGGKSGLAQINAAGQLAAMQDERYLVAALSRGKDGKMSVDMDAYRRAQGMSFNEVSQLAANKLRDMGKEGVFEWNTRKQEFKDQIAQKLSPFEMNMNMLRQAKAFQSAVPGMSLGSALQSTTGMSADQARALELEAGSRSWYDAQIQQLEAQKFTARDSRRAARARFSTPGLGTRIRRGVKSTLSGLADAISSPFARFSSNLEHASEDEAAAEEGTHIVRISDSALAHDDAERAEARRVGRTSAYRSAFGSNVGEDPIYGGWRMMNRIGSGLGLTALSSANRAVSLASQSRGALFGMNPFQSFGSVDDAMSRLSDVSGGASISRRADSLTVGQQRAADRKLGSNSGLLAQATANLSQEIGKLQAGQGVFGAQALSRSIIRKAFIDAAPPNKKEEAARQFDSDPSIGADLVKTIKDFGTAGQKEVIAKMEEIDEKTGGISRARSREGLQAMVDAGLEAGGLKRASGSVSIGLLNIDANGDVNMKQDASEATLTKLGKVFAHHSDDEIALASAKSAIASEDPSKRAAGVKAMEALRKKHGDKFRDLEEGAAAIGAEGGDVQTALSGMPMSSISGVRNALAGRKRGAMDQALIEKLGEHSSKAGSAKTVLEAAKAMTEDEIDEIADPGLREKVRAMRSGSAAERDKAAEDAAVMVAPAGTESRYGDRGSAAIDKQIADIRDMRDKLSTGEGSDKGQLQAASTQLFSSSVERFGKFVDDLTGHGDNTMLDRSMPSWQSRFGGG